MSMPDLLLSSEDILPDGKLSDRAKTELIARMRVKVRAELDKLRFIPGDSVDLTYKIKVKDEE